MKRTSLLAFALAIGISASAFGVPTVYEDFTSDTDAVWVGNGNRSAAGVNDYGWSNTDNTGNVVLAPSGGVSIAGEVGGFMQRGNFSDYGFVTGSILPTDVIHADGVYKYSSGSGNMFFGFYNQADHMTAGGDPRNFIGIQMDDGVKALYHNARSDHNDRTHAGPANVAGSGATIQWSIDYDGNGQTTFTIGSDVAKVLNSGAGYFTGGGGGPTVFDRFGFFSGSTSDSAGEVYWDDITISPMAIPPGIPGDLNGDTFVNLVDYGIIKTNWLQNVFGKINGDMSNDGVVDVKDFALFKPLYLTANPGSGLTVPVPEPASAVLAALALTGLVWMGRTSRQRARRKLLMKRTSLLAFALAIGISASAFGAVIPNVYENFTNDTDPSWVGSGNRSNPGVNDYGWSNSDNTGNVVTAPTGGVSAAGEVGGFIQRGNMSYYGFATGDINPVTDTIHADGVYRYVSGSGNVFFGFFNDAYHMTSNDSDSRNFIGIQLDDGIKGLYHASRDDNMQREHNGPADVGASTGETIKWSIDYDPVNEMAVFTIGSDGATVFEGASYFSEGTGPTVLNRFGFFSTENSDAVGEYYFDDITFSSTGTISPTGGLELQVINLLGAGPAHAIESTKTVLVNTHPADSFNIDVHVIKSATGSLNPAGFNGFAGHGVAGWESVAPSANALSELNLTSSTTLAPGAGQVLGEAFTTGATENLTFQFRPVGASSSSNGTVVYKDQLAGDVNGDGVVNIFDINAISSNWSSASLNGDANFDGIVNIFDVNFVSSHWANTLPGGAAAVPEPTSAILAALGLLGLVCAAGARSRRTTQR